MRISEYDKSQMKSKILTDLFEKEEKRIKEQKEQFVIRNHQEFMAPMEARIRELPEYFWPMAHRLVMRVRYRTSEIGVHRGLNQEWIANVTPAVLGPIETTGTVDWKINCPKEVEVQPGLFAELAPFIDHVLEVEREKDEIKHFLTVTLNQYSGPKLLRQHWPVALHKYLPGLQPSKTRRRINSPEITDERLPESLRKWLTLAMLEN